MPAKRSPSAMHAPASACTCACASASRSLPSSAGKASKHVPSLGSRSTCRLRRDARTSKKALSLVRARGGRCPADRRQPRLHPRRRGLDVVPQDERLGHHARQHEVGPNVVQRVPRGGEVQRRRRGGVAGSQEHQPERQRRARRRRVHVHRRAAASPARWRRRRPAPRARAASPSPCRSPSSASASKPPPIAAAVNPSSSSSKRVGSGSSTDHPSAPPPTSDESKSGLRSSRAEPGGAVPSGPVVGDVRAAAPGGAGRVPDRAGPWTDASASDVRPPPR